MNSPRSHPGVAAATRFGEPASLNEQLIELQKRAGQLDADGILRLALGQFPARIAVTSSFGTESVVLLHHIARIDPTVPVLFLNTGKLFGETMRYRDRLQDVLGLTDVRAIGPHPDDLNRADPNGTLWNQNPDTCCHIRKTLPVRRALKDFDAEITGRKRFQTLTRNRLTKVGFGDGLFHFNPLADWSLGSLKDYVAEHRLPEHPLVHDGYTSIGCIPCTGRVAIGEGYRDGRWPGLDKDECGIHHGLDGDGI